MAGEALVQRVYCEVVGQNVTTINGRCTLGCRFSPTETSPPVTEVPNGGVTCELTDEKLEPEG